MCLFLSGFLSFKSFLHWTIRSLMNHFCYGSIRLERCPEKVHFVNLSVGTMFKCLYSLRGLPSTLSCLQFTFKYLWKEWKQAVTKVDVRMAIMLQSFTKFPFPPHFFSPSWSSSQPIVTHLILFTLGHSLGTSTIQTYTIINSLNSLAWILIQNQRTCSAGLSTLTLLPAPIIAQVFNPGCTWLSPGNF